MSEKLKSWKTFPCRDCLMNNNCSEVCFEFPIDVSCIESYISEHGLQETCLTCGEPRVEEYYICEKCLYYIVYSMYKEEYAEYK